MATSANSWTLQESLAEDDPEIMSLIKEEKARQRNGLELIASEVSWLLPIFCVLNILATYVEFRQSRCS